jgi:hypothetical protein
MSAWANSSQDPISKITRAKWIGSVAQVFKEPALQVQSPEFKTQSHLKWGEREERVGEREERENPEVQVHALIITTLKLRMNLLPQSPEPVSSSVKCRMSLS